MLCGGMSAIPKRHPSSFGHLSCPPNSLPQEKRAHLKDTYDNCAAMSSKLTQVDSKAYLAAIGSLLSAAVKHKSCEALLASEGAYTLVESAVKASSAAFLTMAHPLLQNEQRLAQGMEQLMPQFNEQLARFQAVVE